MDSDDRSDDACVDLSQSASNLRCSGDVFAILLDMGEAPEIEAGRIIDAMHPQRSNRVRIDIALFCYLQEQRLFIGSSIGDKMFGTQCACDDSTAA